MTCQCGCKLKESSVPNHCSSCKSLLIEGHGGENNECLKCSMERERKTIACSKDFKLYTHPSDSLSGGRFSRKMYLNGKEWYLHKYFHIAALTQEVKLCVAILYISTFLSV